MRRLFGFMLMFLAMAQGRAANGLEYVLEEVAMPGAQSTGISDINDLGQYVGTYTLPDFSNHAFFFDGSDYVTIDFPGAEYITPTAINDLGVIAGHYESEGRTKQSGFLFNNGEFTQIDLPGAQYTQFLGMNNGGQIVGTYTREDFSGFAFAREPDGTFREITGPAGEFLFPSAIANDGKILANFYPIDVPLPFALRGLLIQDSDFTVLPVYGNRSIAALDLNDLGTIVGYAETGVGSVYGFVVDGVFHRILPEGSRTSYVTAVNNAGVFAGNYVLSVDGSSHTFIAHPVPEPGTGACGLLLVLSSVVCTARRRNREIRLSIRNS